MIIVSEMLGTSNKSDINHYVVFVVNENSYYIFTVNGLLLSFISVLITIVNESILSDELEAMYSYSLVRRNDPLGARDTQTL